MVFRNSHRQKLGYARLTPGSRDKKMLSFGTLERAEDADDSDEDVVQMECVAEPSEPKVTSLKHAISKPDDVTHYVTNENLVDANNSLENVASNVKSVWLERRQRASVQRAIMGYFK